jgi:hypothetical protein
MYRGIGSANFVTTPQLTLGVNGTELAIKDITQKLKYVLFLPRATL